MSKRTILLSNEFRGTEYDVTQLQLVCQTCTILLQTAQVSIFAKQTIT